jgi:DNA-binding LytR/AlgR family response regulator
MPDLHLIARCSNALEANDILRKNQIDLIFLDIQMPQLSGVEFIKALPNPPMFIFTTAYSNYALDGFELNAIDYLLKPISIDRFMKAVNKAMEQYELRKREESTEGSSQGEGVEFFFVKADKKLVKIKYDEILYIESLKEYVKIHTAENYLVTKLQIGEFDSLMASPYLLRVHKSFIINLDKVTAYSANVIEIGSHQIPIGRTYKELIMKHLKM